MLPLDKEPLEEQSDTQPFVFVDEQSTQLFKLACKVAVTDVSVLINGPTGAGKEVIARVIHESSPRANGPFIAINCAAIPASLAEDMLFGHEKGAFTGANSVSTGCFEQANGGTLFLDEVGEMPMELQAKLLRVLQEKQVTRVGGSSSVAVDARIVAATNINLKQAVAMRAFREDLYYRLSGFKLTQLPLNQRIKDIAPLALLMIQKHSKKPFPRLSSCAKKLLEDYSWPGNVRELENLICRSLILCNGEEILESDIMFDEEEGQSAPEMTCRNFDVSDSQEIFLNDIEKNNKASELPHERFLMSNLRNEVELQNIIAALKIAPTRNEAAEKLGISPRTLRYKINKLRDLGMPVPAAYARI
ncbi:MAG: sigma-54-dependent Fis family transcriptional regulator [Gammaproteobacteria bacterium]|nr:sigma-54-dependent Fis family transcriptional regulator [Gammaproteobacteria bacterium]